MPRCTALTKKGPQCSNNGKYDGCCGIHSKKEECFMCNKTSSTVTTLDCGHRLHTPCLNKWKKQCRKERKDVTCPFCRSVVEVIDDTVNGETTTNLGRLLRIINANPVMHSIYMNSWDSLFTINVTDVCIRILVDGVLMHSELVTT